MNDGNGQNEEEKSQADSSGTQVKKIEALAQGTFEIEKVKHILNE